jgi:hypothetical protein
VSCAGGTDGAVDLTATGGTGTLTYTWDDASTSTTEDLASVGAATFNVTVTDTKSCQATASATVGTTTTIVDQTLTATLTEVCSGSGTTVTTASSESGVSYSLYEVTGNTVVDGPTAGTGSGLTLNTGNISTATDFYIKGETSTGIAQGAGSSLSFNGSGNVVSTGLNINPSTIPTLTMEAWVNTNTLSGDRMLWTIDNGGWDRGLIIRGGTYHIFAGQDINTTVVPSTNTWEHIAVSYSSSDVKLFINGSLVY